MNYKADDPDIFDEPHTQNEWDQAMSDIEATYPVPIRIIEKVKTTEELLDDLRRNKQRFDYEYIQVMSSAEAALTALKKLFPNK